MNEVERIADQLRRAVEGEAWHGRALLELLEGMSAEEASLRTSEAHTLWEIVSHIAVWMSASRRRVQGEAVSLADVVAGRVGLDQAPPRREFD